MVVQTVQALWYKKRNLSRIFLWPFIPLSILYATIITLRRLCYRAGLFQQRRFPVPVIVVGNLTVGGTGKTPLVIHICTLLKERGLNPGIISRGYKGKIKTPSLVTESSDPKLVGDEAILMARKLNCPIVVGANRPDALGYLLKTSPVNVVISDDGLQHYALYRDIEILVIDGLRRFGNGYCLPIGPLREPIDRLNSVDLVITNGGIPNNNEYDMDVKPSKVYNAISKTQTKMLAYFKDKVVHAVAGIGHPERFFRLLEAHHIRVIPHPYPDHYAFKANDIEFFDEYPVLMTEKDAVKCSSFASSKHWVLPIKAMVSPLFDARLLNLLQERYDG